MSDDQIRIAVATALGVVKIVQSELDSRCFYGSKPVPGRDGVAEAVDVPDYPNDLNAVHAAEETLTDAACQHYIDLLVEVTMANQMPGLPDGQHNYWLVYHATARQRAEAFLRTLGKWVEGKETKV
jgi:hypothetical protein